MCVVLYVVCMCYMLCVCVVLTHVRWKIYSYKPVNIAELMCCMCVLYVICTCYMYVIYVYVVMCVWCVSVCVVLTHTIVEKYSYKPVNIDGTCFFAFSTGGDVQLWDITNTTHM